VKYQIYLGISEMQPIFDVSQRRISEKKTKSYLVFLEREQFNYSFSSESFAL